MERVGYDRAPVAPALAVFKALCEHVSGLVAATPDALAREVKLLDAPGEDPYAMTVEEVLRMEVKHAGDHLSTVEEIRKAR
jgi:hypothetical protein